MPLLRMNAFGEIEEFGFGNESRKAEVTGDDGNVMVGEYGSREYKARGIAQAKQKKIEQQKRLVQVQNRQIAQAQAQAKQMQDSARKKELAKHVQAARNRASDIKLMAISQSRRPLVDTQGFQTEGRYISRKEIIGGKDNDFGQRGMNWPPQSNFAKKVKAPQALPIKKILGERTKASLQHPLVGVMAPMGADEAMGKIKFKKPKIKTPKIISKTVKEIGKGAGAIYQAPLKLGHKVMTTVPGVKDVYKGLDKLTGNTLTSLHRTVMLPGQALRGKPISKGEMIEAIMNCVKVGAIIVSGGSAVALIGAASGALKGGPLGKTSFGRTLLSVGEIAGLAYGAGQGLSMTLQKKATDVVSQKAASEVGKNAGPLGAIAASAAIQAGAAGAGASPSTPGDKIPNAATNAGAKAVSKAADQAAVNAAKQLQSSGIKFSSEAAKAEAQKVVTAQAKGMVATEFKKKTGIPLDLATKIASGQIPSPAEVRNKLMSDLAQTPDRLKNEIANVQKQMTNAEPNMRKVLAQKQQIFEKEIQNRDKHMAIVQKKGADELVAFNTTYKKKAEGYVAQVEDLQNVSARAQELRKKAESTANFAERDKYLLQAAALENQIMAKKKSLSPVEDELVVMAVESERIKEDQAARLAIAEHGGQTKWTPGMGRESSELSHPMLIYGLV